MSADTVPLTGWGRTAPTAARPIHLRSYAEAVAAVRDCGARGGIPRGLGRAYGDAAQNAGGAVFDMTALDRVHAIDAEGGTVLCDAGVSLHRLMQVPLPLGWFVPVTPGTRHVTVGGAIGADVHGRNHHVAGSFSRHVLSFELSSGRHAPPWNRIYGRGGLGLPGLAGLLDELDEEVAAAGGRVCLAKDSRLRPDLLAAMYPRLDDFRALRAELDPRGVFTSDLSRRLTL
jgi:FAD/FMN-containing dehydrogenase